MQEKLDAHSHFFPDYLGPENSPATYIEKSREIGIVAAVLSPAPSPKYPIQNNVLHRPCLWRWTDKGLVYLEQFVEKGSGEVLEEKSAKRRPILPY